MGRYGTYGRPVALLEAYIDWSDQMLELQEADTKMDFVDFLFGPISTSLYAGYSRVAPQYRRYARVESVGDFREKRIKGLNGLRGLGYVGDHGTYPGMRRTQRPSASIAVDTYGGVYAITRQAIRNDESNELLNRNPGDMGFAIGRFVAETVVALVESNPNAPDGNPMIGGGRGNSTTSALSEDSLVDAIDWMQDQVDDDGNKITIAPRTLLVKSARQQLIAGRILRSQQTGTQAQYAGAAGAGTNVFDKGNDNPLEGILPDDAVVREPFLNDANDWYLIADPNDVPAFSVAFLDGNEQPFIGIKDPQVRSAVGAGTDPYTYELDSIDFKVRHDFGVAVVDPRGVYKGIVP